MKGDKVLVSAHSRELQKHGYGASTGNLSAAYLVGLLLASKAKKNKVTGAIVDLGLYRKCLGSRLFAVIKGAKEGGLDIPADEKALPDDARVNGMHIEAYAQSLKEDKTRFDRQFSSYVKNKVDPTKITSIISSVKEKLSA